MTLRPTSCENFATLRPRVRMLFAFFEISKCPTTEVHDIDTAFIHARASGKSKNDGVGKKLLHTDFLTGHHITFDNILFTKYSDIS